MFLWNDNLYAYEHLSAAAGECERKGCKREATRVFEFFMPAGFSSVRALEHCCDEHTPLNRAPYIGDPEDHWAHRFVTEQEEPSDG